MAATEQLNLVLFCHPQFWVGQSMTRFARMLQLSYEARGHHVQILSPTARCYKLFSGSKLAKWAAYVDQYILFPREIRKALKNIPPDAVFVFCDQALGPWMPLVAHRPHVVHVHDLLALRSALGDVPENPTSITGSIYQRYIRRGFRHARHFISVTDKTREDLHRFGNVAALTSEVVHNGLAFPYSKLEPSDAFRILRAADLPANPRGMLLNVGGRQWYKNRSGIIALYARYATQVADPLPLWCLGAKASKKDEAALQKVPSNGSVLFFQNLDDRTLQAAYSYARMFLFPSLAEGFGWPLIEAQACGCPVITTNEAPMNEVAGPAARYLPRLQPGGDMEAWVAHGAETLKEVLSQTDAQRTQISERGIAWAKGFDTDTAIDKYLAVYRMVLERCVDKAAIELEAPNIT